MLRLFSPLSDTQLSEISEIIIADETRRLTYEPVGLARSLQTPEGFHENYHHDVIGHGREIFELGKQIITDLDHLNWDGIGSFSTSDKL